MTVSDALANGGGRVVLLAAVIALWYPVRWGRERILVWRLRRSVHRIRRRS